MPDRQLYRFHVENLRVVETGLKSISLLARTEIAKGNTSKVLRSLINMYALVLGCWAETRLKKLLYENAGFDGSGRATIIGRSSKIEQWKALVDCAFRKHFDLGNTSIDRISVGVAPFARYEILHEVLDQDLKIIIQIRNKLAHGQWFYPLNAAGTNVDQDQCGKIRNENLLSLQFKFALLKSLTDMINDLVVSPDTFERDFDHHYRNLEQQRSNLRNRKYSKYEKSLVARRDRYRGRNES